MRYLSSEYSSKAILLFFFLIGVNAALKILPIVWIITGIGTVFLFFHFSSKWTKNWALIPERLFKKKIFKYALTIRLAYVVISYGFFILMTGKPFEFQAADSIGYDRLAGLAKNFILSGEYHLIDKFWYLKTSSKGYVIFLGIIYTLFDSILVGRVIQALFGAWTCVLIYDLAKRSFGASTARISSIMAVLAPPLIYYCGLNLKESLMAFIVVVFLNVADRLLRTRIFRVRDLCLLILVGRLLFFFRAALAIALLLSFLSALLFLTSRTSPFVRRFGISIVLMISLAIIFQTPVFDEAEHYYQMRETNLEQQMRHFSTRKGGNVLASYGSKVILMPLAVIGPLPTLVNTGQKNVMMLAGSMFSRNILIFFTFLTFFSFIKKKVLFENILLLAFMSFWLFILGNSGFALSDRFHLVLVPIILIYSGYGITLLNTSSKKYYQTYLLLLTLLVTAWNVFKLVGRGMI